MNSGGVQAQDNTDVVKKKDRRLHIGLGMFTSVFMDPLYRF